MELIDQVALATIASGSAAIVGIGISLYNVWRTETQIGRQKKVDSARFTIDFIEKILTVNQSAIRILDVRQTDKTKKFNEDYDVESLLNGLENVVQFINDDVIDKNQALNTLRITLHRLKNDTEVKRIIDVKQNGPNKKAFEKVITFWNNEIN